MGPGKLISGLTARLPGLSGNTICLDPKTSKLCLSERAGTRLSVTDLSGRIFRNTYALDSERKHPDREIILISPKDLPLDDISVMAAITGSREDIERYCTGIVFCPRIYRPLPGGKVEEDRALAMKSVEAVPEPLRKWLGKGSVLFNCHAAGEQIDPFTVFLGLVHETSHLEFFDKWEDLLEEKGSVYSLLKTPVREFYANIGEWNAGVKLINNWPFEDKNPVFEGKKEVARILQQCRRNICTTFEGIKAFHFDGHLKGAHIPETDSDLSTIELTFTL